MKTVCLSSSFFLLSGLLGCSSPSQETAAVNSVQELADVEIVEEDISTEDDFDAQQVIQGYFDSVDQSKPQEIIQGREFAAEGSNADKYAIAQAAFNQAQMDAGTLELNEMHFTLFGDEGYMCDIELADSSKAEMKEATGDFSCYEYSNFEFEEGKLSNFFAGSSSLEGRIAIGDGDPLAIGDWGRVKYVSAYVNIGGNLFVTFEVSSMVDGLQLPWEATLVLDNGRVMEAGWWEAPNDLDADRVANIGFVFPAADLGGTVEMVFMDSDFNERELAIPLVTD